MKENGFFRGGIPGKFWAESSLIPLGGAGGEE